MTINLQGIIEACRVDLDNWTYELRLIAKNHSAGSIREANEARKACMAALQYEGCTSKQANAILRKIENQFGLI